MNPAGEDAAGGRDGDGLVRCPDCGEGSLGLDRPKCDHCGFQAHREGRILRIGEPADERDYPAEGAQELARVESQHFWFASRNKMIAAMLEKHRSDARRNLFAEVGCGTGYVMAGLEARGWACVGIDMHMAGLRIAESRVRGTLVCGDLRRLRFRAPFDAIGLFDVVEHLDDDVAVLRLAAEQLAPGGLVAVTVPAGMGLWTEFDELAGHKRRYNRAMLRRVFLDAGLQPLDILAFFSFAAPPVWIQRKLLGDKSRPKSLKDYLRPPGRVANSVFGALATAERAAARVGIHPPFGTSLIGIARTR